MLGRDRCSSDGSHQLLPGRELRWKVMRVLQPGAAALRESSRHILNRKGQRQPLFSGNHGM